MGGSDISSGRGYSAQQSKKKRYLLPVPDSSEIKVPGEKEERPGQDAETGGAHQGVDQAELQPNALLSLQVQSNLIKKLEFWLLGL